LARRGSRESRGACGKLLLPVIGEGQGQWGRKRATAKWASTVCRLTETGKRIWVDGSDPIRNENRISDFALTFSNNVGKEDKFYQEVD
jgi:hypothetical protein